MVASHWFWTWKVHSHLQNLQLPISIHSQMRPFLSYVQPSSKGILPNTSYGCLNISPESPASKVSSTAPPRWALRFRRRARESLHRVPRCQTPNPLPAAWTTRIPSVDQVHFTSPRGNDLLQRGKSGKDLFNEDVNSRCLIAAMVQILFVFVHLRWNPNLVAIKSNDLEIVWPKGSLWILMQSSGWG